MKYSKVRWIAAAPQYNNGVSINTFATDNDSTYNILSFDSQNGFKVANLDYFPASEGDLPSHREDTSEPRGATSATWRPFYQPKRAVCVRTHHPNPRGTKGAWSCSARGRKAS